MSDPGPNISFNEQRARSVFTPPCIIGLGIDGVFVSSPESTWPSPMKTSMVLIDMAYEAGEWHRDAHSRMLADTTGDGRKDIVKFGHDGVWIAQNSGNHTFEKSRFALRDFGHASGWRHDRHLRMLVDLRGTGRVDIVGFADDGVRVSLNQGEGTYAPRKMVLGNFGNKQGWRVDEHPRYLADITGNGFPDIIGFGKSHTYIAHNGGDGTFRNAESSPNLDAFSYLYGWRVDLHPRHLVDLTGDGRADILGFKNDGVFVSLNDGQGNFTPMTFAVHGFGTRQGWQTDKHPRFVLPLTDKKTADIIGFGDAGVYVSMGKGDGTFEAPKLVLEEFRFSRGWRTDRHPRFLVDLTGDGRPDIVGLDEGRVLYSLNTGHGTFGPVRALSTSSAGIDLQLTASEGWTCDKTVRFVTEL